MKTTTTKCTKNHSGNHTMAYDSNTGVFECAGCGHIRLAREIAGTTVRAWGAILPAYYADGQAHVWDPVAKHYTTCHPLTATQIARVRRLASRD
jgi:hypothetical protein